MRSLLLLLALWSWPFGAAAVPLVAADRDAPDAVRGQGASYAAEGLRSSGGINLLGSIDVHRRSGAGAPCGHGSGSTTAGKLHLRARGDLFRARRPGGCAPHAPDLDAAVAPLCECLPYFATAPPSWR